MRRVPNPSQARGALLPRTPSAKGAPFAHPRRVPNPPKNGFALQPRILPREWVPNPFPRTRLTSVPPLPMAGVATAGQEHASLWQGTSARSLHPPPIPAQRHHRPVSLESSTVIRPRDTSARFSGHFHRIMPNDNVPFSLDSFHADSPPTTQRAARRKARRRQDQAGHRVSPLRFSVPFPVSPFRNMYRHGQPAGGNFRRGNIGGAPALHA